MPLEVKLPQLTRLTFSPARPETLSLPFVRHPLTQPRDGGLDTLMWLRHPPRGQCLGCGRRKVLRSGHTACSGVEARRLKTGMGCGDTACSLAPRSTDGHGLGAG